MAQIETVRGGILTGAAAMLAVGLVMTAPRIGRVEAPASDPVEARRAAEFGLDSAMLQVGRHEGPLRLFVKRGVRRGFDGRTDHPAPSGSYRLTGTYDVFAAQLRIESVGSDPKTGVRWKVSTVLQDTGDGYRELERRSERE